MREFLILTPILALFAVGLLITIWSGVVSLATPDGRRAAIDNLSGMLVRLMGYVAGLIAVQRFVGFPIELPW